MAVYGGKYPAGPQGAPKAGRLANSGGGGHGGNPYHDARGEFTTSGQAVIVRGKDAAGKVRAVLVKDVGGKHAHRRAVQITKSVKGFNPTSASFADALTGRSLGGHSASLRADRTLVDHFSETKALTQARRGR